MYGRGLLNHLKKTVLGSDHKMSLSDIQTVIYAAGTRHVTMSSRLG